MNVRNSRAAATAIWSVVIAGIAALSLGVVYGVQLLWAHRELREELERIDAAGEPTTSVQLADLYAQPPKDEDATPLWLDATSEMERVRQQEVLRFCDVPFPSADGVWPDTSLAEQLVRKYREPLDMMHRAADQGGVVRYPVDFSAGLDAELPHANAIHQGATVLAHEASLMARRGDGDRALRAVRTMLAAARTLDNEPILVSQLTRAASIANAVVTFERLLPAIAVSDGHVCELRRLLQDVRYERALRLSVLSQRAMDIDWLLEEDPRASLEFDEGDREPPASGLRLYRVRDLTLFLRRARDLVDATAMSGAPRRLHVEGGDFELLALRRPPDDADHPWAAYLVGPVSFIVDACFLGEARVAAADAALAIVLYRRATGRIPQRLDELVPEYLRTVPLDAFNGEPLHYRVEDRRCVVYSVGVDRTDDDAAPFVGENKPYDILFSLTFGSAAASADTGGAD